MHLRQGSLIWTTPRKARVEISPSTTILHTYNKITKKKMFLKSTVPPRPLSCHKFLNLIPKTVVHVGIRVKLKKYVLNNKKYLY